MKIVGLILMLSMLMSVPTVQTDSPGVAAVTTAAFKRGDCANCQKGAQEAWFYGYDSARACGYPDAACIAAGDRARACYIRANWDTCSSCGGMIPEQSECGQ